MLGVTCEACHGAGAKHVSSAQALVVAGMTGEPKGPFSTLPHSTLTDSVDFCGACHSTWWDVKLSGSQRRPPAPDLSLIVLKKANAGERGMPGSRALPATIRISRCKRKPLLTTASVAGCHVKTGEKKTDVHPGDPCPTNTKDCVSCHMEKVYVPEMHYKFTDHRIRIVRPNEAFPE